jgi:DNA-binding protein YbaB
VSEAAKRLLDRIEALDATVAENRYRSESYQRMARELVEVQGRATSPDGLVTATATAGGALLSITFSERVRTTSPPALADVVLRTITTARAAAAHEQAEVVRRGLDDTELLDQVLAIDEQLFGDRPPVAPGPTSARPRRQVPEEDVTYEDFSAFRNFRDT